MREREREKESLLEATSEFRDTENTLPPASCPLQSKTWEQRHVEAQCNTVTVPGNHVV
jgi:hypothetical protein